MRSSRRKFIRCVTSVTKKQGSEVRPVNAFAVCYNSTKYKGTSNNMRRLSRPFRSCPSPKGIFYDSIRKSPHIETYLSEQRYHPSISRFRSDAEAIAEDKLRKGKEVFVIEGLGTNIICPKAKYTVWWK
jgi:hypothetical protein